MMIKIDAVKIFLNFKQGDTFCICLALSLIVFIINFVLVLSVRGYGQRQRLWQYLIYLCAVIWQISSDLFSKSGLPLSLYLLSILLFMSLPSVVIKKRVVRTTKKQAELVKMLDRKVKRENNFSLDEQEELDDEFLQPAKSSVMDCVDRLNNCLNKPNREITSEGLDSQIARLDFSHVKNVISRLDAFGLNQSDRRLIEDLKIAVALAEKGEHVVGLKSKINDGLGALLKIMSKYGV